MAKVVVFGGEVRQLQAQVRPDRLVAYGLAIYDVLAATRDATGVRGAGFIDTGPQRIVGRTLVLVLANLPFALVGSVFAVFGTGGLLSLGSLVGFVTLFGITTRNSILLVSRYQHLVEVQGLPWNLETSRWRSSSWAGS